MIPPPDSFDAAHGDSWREAPEVALAVPRAAGEGVSAKAVQALAELALQPQRCSFCTKDRREVDHLVASPHGAAMCDECLASAIPIVAQALGCAPSQVYSVLLGRQREARIRRELAARRALHRAAGAPDPEDNGGLRR
jgi:fructose-1,6-bisphosphatase/sedoheptulose 1,7-bisphosphatase-like protein